MKKNILTLVVLFAALFTAEAQTAVTEPNYALAERFSLKKIGQMVYSTSVRPHWFSNSDKFWYEWNTAEGKQYWIVDPAAGTKTPVFDMEDIAMQLSLIVKDPFDAQHIPFRKLKLKDDRLFTFEIQSTQLVEKKDAKDGKEEKGRKGGKEKKVFRFEYDIASRTLKDVTEQEEVKDFPRWASVSPDGSKAVYMKNYNLFWMTMEDLLKLRKDDKDSTVVDHQLTFDGTKDFYWAGGNYRAAEIKDTAERFRAQVCWSPDSKHFAVQKYDMSPLKELWVINSVSQPRPTLESYKYQMPGEPGAVEYLYVFDAESGVSRQIDVAAFKDQTVWVETAPRLNREANDDYMVTKWLGDSGKFYIGRQSRDMKRIDICVVDVASGSAETVIEERMNTYVEALAPRLVNGGKDIVWWSERNGWAQLYLYGSDGTFKRALTRGAFHVERILGADDAAKTLYFTANGVNKDENPYNAHVYRIGYDGTGLKQLDAAGFNDSGCSMSDDCKCFVANYSRVDSTPRVDLFDNTGRRAVALEEADLSRLFAAGYKFPEPFKVKAADGVTDLYGYMYKPFDFDSTKVYPIIDYVYPGPQVEGNFEAWTSSMLRTDRLAQIGFIVITVGNRGGHPNRSKWYHNYGYGNLRDYGLEDQKYAIQQLAAMHSFMDISRVGIHGHSGGGFMSTAAILKYPDFFKVAVSCSGNHDNSMYNRWWSETHHGVLEEISAEGDTTFKYSIDKNQDIAKNLKGHLMLVTGDIDDNVHPGNTIRVVNALIRANKRFDLLILPGQRHGYGDMNEYFFWRMADYYSEWLLGSSHRYEVDVKEMNND